LRKRQIGDMTGGLVLSVQGRAPYPATHWEGQWVILSATGELTGLHGQGEWWGPGAGGPYLWGDIDLGGRIHFGPN
jgi:hypothetical protein